MFAKIRSTLSSIGQNWAMTQRRYPTLPLEVGGFFLLAVVVVGAPVTYFLNWPSALLVALPLGLLAGTFWFSRRAMRAAYGQVEGQPGAAAAVIGSLRGGWLVTPGVAVNKNQDIVSRVVGKPGVILVSEGPSTRVVHLLANERKKTARWLPEVPIYEIQVGVEADQVRIGKLQKELTRLPRSLRPAEVNDIRRRLDALSAREAPVPIPKGPMPKGGKIPKSMRG